MNIENVTVEKTELHRLLSTGSGDAALLYLYIRAGNDPEAAGKELSLTGTRYSCAAATLRQLGLWPETRKSVVLSGERPAYSEKDVLSAMDTDTEFRMLYGEVQRLLGRTLNTEELKILLGFVRYLGLPCEVISVLVTYCRDRARMKGKFRNPSLRTIEKEAYHWAEEGIDTMEEAAAYIHRWNQRHSRLARLLELLQIRGRSLTPAEERYADNWLEMGFEDEVIRMAYEKTCVNTGGLSWPYMNKILTSWKNAGLLTAQQVKNGDKKSTVPKGGSGELGAAELEAIQRILREG